jgi:hypothetical protein
MGWREGLVVIVSKEGIGQSRRDSEQIVAACAGSTGRANNLIKDEVSGDTFFHITY